MSHEKWLVTGLSIVVISILALVAALTWQIGWSVLASLTLLFILSYPLIWLAWRCYSFWCQAIMQLTTYTQVLNENESNLSFKKQHPDNLLLDLQKEIYQLSTKKLVKSTEQQTLNHIISNILDAWPIPVCLFDQHLRLLYRNEAMNQQIAQPMLLNSTAESLGFSLNHEQLHHEKFNDKWQSQTINYSLDNEQKEKQWLFTSINISPLLNQQQSHNQQNLIRVLSHELRNSLTPMYSMTDTLLCNDTLNETQTRKVLSRIQQRSQRLLTFISEYSQLTQLPSPKVRWFSFFELIDEAKSMIDTHNCQVTINGSEQCFGDRAQLTQVMINILKNAQQVQAEISVDINLYHNNDQQIIEVNDTGPGFANLANVLTPFYTTKSDGSGIGLALCVEIIHNHNGQLQVANNDKGGAKILMTWPLQ